MAVVPPARSNLRTHALAYLCLAALFLISVTEWTRDAFDRFEAIRHGSVYARERFELIDPNRTATSLAPEAQAAGLKEGDVVLAVNGRPVGGSVVYYGALRRARVGDRLLVRAHSVRPDALNDLSIALRPMADDPTFRTAPLSVYIYFVLGMIPLPAVSPAPGFWVAAVRITDRSAWLLLVLLLS